MKRSTAIGLCAANAVILLSGCATELPENDPIKEARWLPQNWGAEERFWYHHATQGTASVLVPYEWFLALEQPTLWLFGDPSLFSDPEYLTRYGFIPGVTGVAKESDQAKAAGYYFGKSREYGSPGAYDPKLFAGNPDGLPVGFARTRRVRIP